MTIIRSLILFVVAALAEIGGAWLVWQGVREHRGLIWIGAVSFGLRRLDRVEGRRDRWFTGGVRSGALARRRTTSAAH